MQGIDSPARRQVLRGLGGLLAVGAVGAASAEGHEEVTVTLASEGTQAWLLQSADEDVGQVNTANPTLTLSTGTRYRFENLGWDFHPLAFRDAGNEALLTQSGQGTFEDDEAVDWVDEGDELAFTLTEELAADLDNYVCTAHPSMEGSIGTDDPDDDPADDPDDDPADDPDDDPDDDPADDPDDDPDDADDDGGGLYDDDPGGGADDADDTADDDTADDTDDTADDADDADDFDDADDADDADDDGPGFGPLVALAGLGGAAGYAASKLRGEGDDTRVS